MRKNFSNIIAEQEKYANFASVLGNKKSTNIHYINQLQNEYT